MSDSTFWLLTENLFVGEKTRTERVTIQEDTGLVFDLKKKHGTGKSGYCFDTWLKLFCGTNILQCFYFQRKAINLLFIGISRYIN